MAVAPPKYYFLCSEIPPNLRSDGSQRCPQSLHSTPPRKNQPTLQCQRWCRVTFSYDPEEEDELSLHTGELVQILEEIEDGWCLGKKNSQLGAFPSNFVEELSGPPPDVGFMEPKMGSGKLRPKLTNETFLLKDPKEQENEEKKAAPQKGRWRSQPHMTPQPSNVPRYCRAMFDHKPENNDELPFQKGDLILLLSKETVDMGWWKGECRGKKGLFPHNFVTQLSPTEPEVKSKVPVRKTSTELKEQKKMDTPKLVPTPGKKAAPLPPPVPPKARPALSLPPKSSGIPASCAATPGGRGKGKAMVETNTLGAPPAPSAMLSHPSTSRPKMPGKRLPGQLMSSSLEEKRLTHPLRSTEKAKGPELGRPKCRPTREEPERLGAEEGPISLKDLKAELGALKILMDSMHLQHRREMEELKGQLSRELAKRAALQAEVEWLKQAVPGRESLDQACKKPNPARGAMQREAPAVPSLPPSGCCQRLNAPNGFDLALNCCLREGRQEGQMSKDSPGSCA